MGTDHITDFRCVSVRGTFNYARARVLWANGLLRVFTLHGLVLELLTDKPVRVPGHLGRWDTQSDKGTLELRMKCVTCGGRPWWRVVRKSSEELWRAV